MSDIYYCYERSTGAFAGSGVTQVDTDSHGSTLVVPPETNPALDKLTWTGVEWVVTTSSPVITSLIAGLAEANSLEAVRDAASNALQGSTQ